MLLPPPKLPHASAIVLASNGSRRIPRDWPGVVYGHHPTQPKPPPPIVPDAAACRLSPNPNAFADYRGRAGLQAVGEVLQPLLGDLPLFIVAVSVAVDDVGPQDR